MKRNFNNVDVTLEGLNEVAEGILFTWTEFVDEEVIDAANAAIEALNNLINALGEMQAEDLRHSNAYEQEQEWLYHSSSNTGIFESY